MAISEDLNVQVNPDTIVGYITSSQSYEEKLEDGRRKPMFVFKAYHMYPILQSPYPDDDTATYTDGEPVYDEDEDFDVDGELINPLIFVCTEGGNAETFEYVPMKATDFKEWLRETPQLRFLNNEEAETVLRSLNLY